MSDRVLPYIEQLDEEQRHYFFYSHMIFPHTADLNHLPIRSAITLTYQVDHNECNFTSAIFQLAQTALDNRQALRYLIMDIILNQRDYMPQEMDGFLVNYQGCHLLHLQRDGSDRTSYTGVIDYGRLREKAHIYYERKRCCLLS